MKGLKINISTDAENSLLKLARARILNLNRKQTAKNEIHLWNNGFSIGQTYIKFMEIGLCNLTLIFLQYEQYDMYEMIAWD
jgi:hypothetical protein